MLSIRQWWNKIKAASLINLAALYRAQGQYPHAEPLFQRAFVLLDQLQTWKRN